MKKINPKSIRHRLIAYKSRHPEASVAETAAAIGAGRDTVHVYFKRLGLKGPLSLKARVVAYKAEHPAASIKDVAAALGGSVSAITVYFSKLGLEGAPSPRVPKLPADDVLLPLLQTTSWTDLAKRFDVNKSAVWRRAQALGMDSQLEHLKRKPGRKPQFQEAIAA